jgi:Protein of unknown function (DUF732)
MKRAAVAALFVGAAMLGAAPAHADDDQFLADVHKAHISAQGGDDELVVLGEGVCKKLGNGYDYKEIAIGLEAGGDFKGFQAGELIAVAAQDLCPQYWPALDREAEQDFGS